MGAWKYFANMMIYQPAELPYCTCKQLSNVGKEREISKVDMNLKKNINESLIRHFSAATARMMFSV